MHCCKLLFALSLFSLLVGTAASQDSQPDPAIRVTLERAYENWRSAMSVKDFQKWEESTAYSRQIETRNRILSQRLTFPQALFDGPIEAPSLGGLTALGVLNAGSTATSSYFGKISFGASEGVAVSDNILVLHFLKEDDRWKFDNLRIVRIGDDGEVLLQIRNADFSFLRNTEFQPVAQLPPVPQPIEMPEYVAEVWVDSTGCETTITVNGILTGKFTNVKTPELVIGGLHRGENKIMIQTRRLPEITSPPRVEIAIYTAKDPTAAADRVFHYKPGANFEAQVTQSFVVE